jgi:hypothetical protein
MRQKTAAAGPMIADTLQSMRELPLSEVAFGQLIAADDDGQLTWGFRAQFETDARHFVARLKNTTGGNGASCVVIEEPNARVLAFDKYILQPEFSRWVNIAAVLNIELMHTALILDGGRPKLVAYVKNAGRIRTDIFLLDLKSGTVSQADPSRDVTTISSFKIGLPEPGDTVAWVFRSHGSGNN